MTTVAIVGGGSYQWTPTLVADLLRTPSLDGCHLVLEDVEGGPLVPMERFVHLAADQLGVSVTVTATTDQRKALDDADFVVVTISTGGFDSMTHDLAVPERYGIRQSVGDTVGPGGIIRALRNIPVLVGIARDMVELCPDAWLLNITNPLTALTRAVIRATGVRAVGLCHEITHFCADVAATFGLPAGEVEPAMVGVNHFPVVTELTIGDGDGLSRLRRLVHDGPADERQAGFLSRHALKLALLDRHGALPGAGDRHLAEFLPGVLTEETGWGEAWGVELTTIDERRGWRAAFEDHLARLLTGERRVPTWPSGELVAPVIDCMLTGERRRLPLNLPNAGQAPGLPADAVVEAMCPCDGDGPQPGPPVTAPAPFDELLRRHVAVQELTVEAALTGDRRLVHGAMLLDPLAGRGDLRATEAMTDDLLAATAPWLDPTSFS